MKTLIDLINGIALLLLGVGVGVSLHSLWRHAEERDELKDWWKLIRNKVRRKNEEKR